jgi:hypothetical protein
LYIQRPFFKSLASLPRGGGCSFPSRRPAERWRSPPAKPTARASQEPESKEEPDPGAEPGVRVQGGASPICFGPGGSPSPRRSPICFGPGSPSPRRSPIFFLLQSPSLRRSPICFGPQSPSLGGGFDPPTSFFFPTF